MNSGYVIGRGDETLGSYLAWFPAAPGMQWVHETLTVTAGWEYEPEWYAQATHEDGETRITGKQISWRTVQDLMREQVEP